MTPETITNGRSPVQASPPQKQEHEFLHGMLPPTSPEENSSCKPAQVAQMSAGSPTRSIAPTVAVSATVALSPAVFLAGSHNSGDSIAIGGVTGDDGGGGAMPGMAPSNGGRQMGGSAELLGSRTGGIDLEGGGISSKKMSVEGFSHPGEPQVRLGCKRSGNLLLLYDVVGRRQKHLANSLYKSTCYHISACNE